MIITPKDMREELIESMKEDLYWQDIYDKNEKIKKIADEIHNKRMLPPPTCTQCIKIAAERYAKSLSEKE